MITPTKPDPLATFDNLTAPQLARFIERHCLQIVKAGYRWRDDWEVNMPAPRGHYMENAERTVAHGSTAEQALRKAYEILETPKPRFEVFK